MLTLLALSILAGQQQVAPIHINLEGQTIVKLALEPTVMDDSYPNLGDSPSEISLSTAKPQEISKEPTYRFKPLYGTIHLGSGPRSATNFAIDESSDGSSRIYVDKNQNGDLTDDGSPEWATTAKGQSGGTEHERQFVVRVSWGTPKEETSSSDYGICIYKVNGESVARYYRSGARTGTIELAGQVHRILLSEYENKANYSIAPRKPNSTSNLQFYLDPDSKTSSTGEDLTEPLNLNGTWFKLTPTKSGDELKFTASGVPDDVKNAKWHGPVRVLKTEGETAPDFTALTPDGKELALSQLRGKTVILDFWATWCGPCQASMPGLEKIYQRVKDKDVVVLSVNVWDRKEFFDEWLPLNAKVKYNFTFAHDPAENWQDKSIASAKYGVTGIPSMFIIDKNGKIAKTMVGSGHEKEIAETLTKLGIPATAPVERDKTD